VERGWSKIEFAECMGFTIKHVDELINGHVSITIEIADHLSRVLGSTSDFWLVREAQYRDALKNLIGAKVKMKASTKKQLNHSSHDHVKEFGNCVGITEGFVDYGNNQTGPEINVRWLPSNLRYAYLPNDLEIINL